MIYDFDEVIDRTQTDSVKWKRYAGKDIIPLWVADMDFKASPPILDALDKVTKEGIICYWQTTDELVEVTLKRLE